MLRTMARLLAMMCSLMAMRLSAALARLRPDGDAVAELPQRTVTEISESDYFDLVLECAARGRPYGTVLGGHADVGRA